MRVCLYVCSGYLHFHGCADFREELLESLHDVTVLIREISPASGSPPFYSIAAYEEINSNCR